MPKIRRQNLPRALYDHLLDRVQQRSISAHQLRLLLLWMDTQPEVPNGRWFKRFPELVVCGDGELIKTFLLPTQAPTGNEIA
ncbi:MAG TPA: hypothetical protein VG146_15490 [Verrucomicrobiae bacterium]|nr:hypothetical protein [Verrucomicrobiae bacterium]